MAAAKKPQPTAMKIASSMGDLRFLVAACPGNIGADA